MVRGPRPDCSSLLFLSLLFPRDLVAILTALEYNQWFTKVSSKDFKLVGGLTGRAGPVGGARVRARDLLTRSSSSPQTCASRSCEWCLAPVGWKSCCWRTLG